MLSALSSSQSPSLDAVPCCLCLLQIPLPPQGQHRHPLCGYLQTNKRSINGVEFINFSLIFPYPEHENLLEVSQVLHLVSVVLSSPDCEPPENSGGQQFLDDAPQKEGNPGRAGCTQAAFQLILTTSFSKWGNRGSERPSDMTREQRALGYMGFRVTL